MIRIDRVAVAPLVAVLGILACVAGRPTQATPLSDRTLVSIVGTNGNSTGSGTFNCSDAAAQFASNPNGNPPVNYIGYSYCQSLPGNKIPNPAKTCMKCNNGPCDSGSAQDPKKLSQNGSCLTGRCRF